MSSLLRVGLTGGIATGKSHVRGRFAERGVPTIDADLVAREVVEPGTPVFDAIVRRFGRSVVAEDGRLNRSALADVVFADAGARHDLEGLVHPAVYDAVQRWFGILETAGRAPLAIADIPLLFETGRDRDFDAVVVVACSPETQLHRVMARDRATEQQARVRIAAQWPIGAKVARADLVIHTDLGFEETERQVDEVHGRLIALAGARDRAADR